VRVDGAKAAPGRLAVGPSTLSGRLGGRRVNGPS
jgi:hypothetical protein